MRIEFTTETESLEGLHLIRQVVDHAIEHRKAQMAAFAERVKRESHGKLDVHFPSVPNYDAAARQHGEQASNLQRPAIVVDESNGEVIDAGNRFRTPPGFGVTSNSAPLGINEQTGQFDNDAVAAAKAFGGGANVLPFPSSVPPTPPAPVSNASSVSAVAPVAASASTAPATDPAGTVASERDKSGTPWDARIHSEARTKNNDGTWRFRRKLDDATKAAVLAEINAGGGTVAAATNNVPPPPSIPPVPPPPPPVTLPPAGAVPVPPPPPVGLPNTSHSGVVPPVNPTSAPNAPSGANASATAASSASIAPAGASPSSGITFRDLVIKLNKALSDGRVTQDALALACSELGIGESPSALGMPDYAHLVSVLDEKLFPTG